MAGRLCATNSGAGAGAGGLARVPDAAATVGAVGAGYQAPTASGVCRETAASRTPVELPARYQLPVPPRGGDDGAPDPSSDAHVESSLPTPGPGDGDAGRAPERRTGPARALSTAVLPGLAPGVRHSLASGDPPVCELAVVHPGVARCAGALAARRCRHAEGKTRGTIRAFHRRATRDRGRYCAGRDRQARGGTTGDVPDDPGRPRHPGPPEPRPDGVAWVSAALGGTPLAGGRDAGRRVVIEQNLREMEISREAYWRRYPGTSPFKLRRRALTVRHCLHVLPGERILELGAGSGLWTEHLTTVLRGENPITAAVFNEEFVTGASAKQLANVKFVHVTDLAADLPAGTFDYVVGTVILCHDLYQQTLAALYRLLKPGGQLLFFEANYWNPQVFLKNFIRPLGRWCGDARCHVGMRKYELMKRASHQGFTNIEIIPYDIIHARLLRSLLPAVQSASFILEHTPVVQDFCGTLYIWLMKPGEERARRPRVNLADHSQLYGSTSVVVPCHNEEMNVPPLVEALVQMYGDYLHEIIIVNDNSTDRTAEVTRALVEREPRIRLINRPPPGGVGRALRDGYAAVTGRYILTMDCDFAQIVPELRDLFDAVAAGRDGAIGSRFSLESVLINYPFFKIVCNRGFHALIRLLLPTAVHDISNNLKLYRAQILKELEIEEDHFAANVETGLKPVLAGYDLQEVPMSWINRTSDMGSSSFNLLRVGPGYLSALLTTIINVWRGRRSFVKLAGVGDRQAPEPDKKLVE